MADPKSIIVSARQAIRIHADEEPLQAIELEKGRNALKMMLSAWQLEKTIDAFEITDVSVSVKVRNVEDALEAQVTLVDEAEQAIVDNLAVRLSSIYGVPVDELTLASAMVGKNAITALGFLNADTKSEFDTALTTLPSNRRGIYRG